MLGNFENLLIDLIDNVDNHINTFLSEVDSSEDTILKSNYLDEQDEIIQDDFMNLVNLSSEVKQTINGVSDITSATPPSLSNIVDDKASTARTIIDVNNDLSSFVSTGRNRINSIDDLLSQIRTLLNKAASQSDGGKLVTSNWILDKSEVISIGLGTLE